MKLLRDSFEGKKLLWNGDLQITQVNREDGGQGTFSLAPFKFIKQFLSDYL